MADPGFDITDLQILKDMMTQMYTVGAQIYEVQDYIEKEVCNKSGFIGLLDPFNGAMDKINTASQSLESTFYTKWKEVAEAVRVAGQDFDATDGHVSGMFAVPKTPHGAI